MKSASSDSPVTLLTVSSEVEAAIIVGALAECEVEATTVGGFTAGFIAEAPGQVSILVRQRDLSRASEVLADVKSLRTDDTTSTNNAEPEVIQRIFFSGPLVWLNGVFFLVWILIVFYQWRMS